MNTEDEAVERVREQVHSGQTWGGGQSTWVFDLEDVATLLEDYDNLKAQLENAHNMNI